MIKRIKRHTKKAVKKVIKKVHGIRTRDSLSSIPLLKLYADYVALRTGWTYEKACTELLEAKECYGISYKDYSNYEFFLIPKESWKEKSTKVKQEKKQRIEKSEGWRRNRRDSFISSVMAETGWTKGKAFREMIICQNRTGMAFEHYVAYKFWNVDADKQLTYFTKGCADALWKKYNTNKVITQILIDKDKFCDHFSDYLGRISIPTYRLNKDTFINAFGTQGKVIFKPKFATGGKGIEVFEYDEISFEKTFSKILELGAGVVEEYIVQHPEMSKLSRKSVNTVRIVTIRTKDDKHGIKPYRVHFLYAGLRVGTGDSYTDNMHSGGMVALIDMETGFVTTNAVDFKYNVHSVHPDTGVKIKGFKIPYFKEAKKLLAKICIEKDIVGYYGWDIAFSDKGPMIIEGNTHPGAEILQTPNVPDGIGMRYVGSPFVKESEMEKPETPYGERISRIDDEGIEFYWKKPERADGYEIFRAYNPDGEYEHIASIETRIIGQYTDNAFDREKKKVYYTVCSYKKIIGNAYSYSEFTKPVVAVFRDEVEIERDTIIMYSGTQRKLNAYYGWGNLKDAEWTSDDEAVAKVDNEGVITAIATGQCTVSCKSKEQASAVSATVVVDRENPEPLGEVVSRYKLEDGVWKNSNAKETKEAVIMMVGDLMCGKKQMEVQYSEEEGWNFNESLSKIREVIGESDLSICNVETLLASGWPYMSDECYIENKNNCNAPSRFLDTVKYGGFDVSTMANNHNCDGGIRALMQTIEQINRYKMINTGVFKDESEQRFALVDVNGIMVGILAYMTLATTFNGKDKDWTQEEKNRHLNIYNRDRAEKDIRECRAAGAEYIIAYMHWGQKNFLSTTIGQKNDAAEIAELGVDYIVGANPHVIQNYQLIKTSDGRKVPCFYSVGNFLSIMNHVKGNKDSVIVRIKLKKDDKGKVLLAENGYIPCFCYRKIEEDNWVVVAVDNKHNTNVTKNNRKSIYNRIVSRIGKDISPY